MKIHIGAGSRFVEIEVNDGSYSLVPLREFVVAIYDHLDEPRLEAASGVGFTAERGDGRDSSPGPDQSGSRTRGFVVRDGHR